MISTVTILILLETSLQRIHYVFNHSLLGVTILILLETSLQHNKSSNDLSINKNVTILILLETSLQQYKPYNTKKYDICHNPYFTGNLFAT